MNTPSPKKVTPKKKKTQKKKNVKTPVKVKTPSPKKVTPKKKVKTPVNVKKQSPKKVTPKKRVIYEDDCGGLGVVELRKIADNMGLTYNMKTTGKKDLCEMIKGAQRSFMIQNLSDILYGDCRSNNKEDLMDLAADLGIVVRDAMTVNEICLKMQVEYYKRYFISRGEKYGVLSIDIADFMGGKTLPGDPYILSGLARTFGNIFPELMKEDLSYTQLANLLEFFRSQIWPMLLTEKMIVDNKYTTSQFEKRVTPVRLQTPKKVIQELEEFYDDVPSPSLID